MASRLYFVAAVGADVTPASPGAEWEHNNGVSRKLVFVVDTSALATTAYSPDAGDDATNRDALHRQYVSGPLLAQAISGTITGQLQCLEADAANNLFLTVVAKVISNDGATARATLLAITRASTELATTLTNRTFPSTALTSYTCIEGDRLLVEVGLAGTPVANGGSENHNGSIRWGCVASAGDLAVNETETAATYRPWIEFSDDLLFLEAVTHGGGSELARLKDI